MTRNHLKRFIDGRFCLNFNKMERMGMGQIMISNADYFLRKEQVDFLKKLRDESGYLKYGIKYKICLN